jgi:peptide/nickel transport system substrate-binding protein
MSLTAACAPFTSRTASSNTTSVPSSNIAPTQVVTGGALVMAQPYGIATTRPYPSPQYSFGWGGLFNPLVSLDAKSQPVACLAESWSVAVDRRSVTLKLRPGVTFHSGRPFTVGDAIWNIEYVKDPKNAAAVGGELTNVNARALDASTLQLDLPDVMPHIFSLLAGVLMIDPQSDIVAHAEGTGPFKLDSLNAGVEIRLVRNERYWRPDRPFLDSLTVRNIPDLASTAIALESGAAHIVRCANNDVQRLNSSDQTTVKVLGGSGSYDFAFNCAEPPFSDKRVRQAFNLSLDRKRFAEKVMQGLTRPTYIIWMKESPAWDAADDIGEYNLGKARQLLADAGHPNGFETKIQANPSLPELLEFDQIVQADLATVGINVTLEELDATLAGTLFTQAKFPAIVNHAYAYGDQDPAMEFTAFALRPEGNASRFSSDEYVRLTDAARREADPAKRVDLYHVIARFVRDEAFLIPVANTVYPWALRANVHGLTRQPLVAQPVPEELWLS